MNIELRAIAPLVVLSALLAVGAQAETVAGWDFSQYRGSGSLTPFTNSLPANYSDLDPTFHAGAESASYGTLHFDGSFGSSSTLTDFLPAAGQSNCERTASGCSVPWVDGPVASNHSVGDISFDAHSVLKAEGQTYQNLLGMQATNNVSVVFAADLTPAATVGSGWSVSFGGHTATGGGPNGGELSCDPPGCSSSVGVEFSTNGSSYTSAGSVNLDATDQRYTVALGGANADHGYVRLSLNPGSGTPIIDNVAVGVQLLPEPGAFAGVLAGAGLLGLLARRRRA